MHFGTTRPGLVEACDHYYKVHQKLGFIWCNLRGNSTSDVEL